MSLSIILDEVKAQLEKVSKVETFLDTFKEIKIISVDTESEDGDILCNELLISIDGHEFDVTEFENLDFGGVYQHKPAWDSWPEFVKAFWEEYEEDYAVPEYLEKAKSDLQWVTEIDLKMGEIADLFDLMYYFAITYETQMTFTKETIAELKRHFSGFLQ